MPGQGTHGGALLKVAQAVDLLQQALPALQAGSHHKRAVLTALNHLDRMAGREVPQGAQETGIKDMLANHMRNLMIQRMLAQRGGMPPQGPSPSMPTGA